MTEEVKTEVEEPENTEVTPEDKSDSQPDTLESVAEAMGWRRDFEGEGKVDAKTFILNAQDIIKSTSKKVGNLHRELDAMRQGISAMKTMYETSNKREVERLNGEIKTLKAERDAAVESGDTDGYKATNQRIEQLEGAVQAAQKTPEVPNQQGPSPEYLAWLENGNEWYEADPEMRQWADGLAQSAEYVKLPMPRLLKIITNKAKEIFPDKFPEKQTKQEPEHPAVATPTRKPSSKRKATAKDLTPEQLNAAKDFVAGGAFKDVDEYARELQEQGVI